MPAICPNEGEIRLGTDLLAGGSLENWTEKLFQNNITPAETDTSATYTEATFTGYSALTLTRTISGSTWSTPASNAVNPIGGEASDARSLYGASANVWSSTSSQTIYGYYRVGATSGKVVQAERFASPIALVNPSTLSYQPVLQIA